MNFIIDACSLIYLTKISVKEDILKLGEINIAQSVKSELLVNAGAFLDAQIIQQNIQARKIHVISTTIPYPTKVVDWGEQESLNLCKQTKETLICDDKRAINVAQAQSIRIQTSEMILLELFRLEMISYDKFEESFKKLARIKSLSAEIVEFFLLKAKHIRNSKK